ncbi:hypothetical protein EQ812_11420 [Staphylococcus lugdunensis]|uniref:Uncharacterized protein n=1 Tax=Staphylococcus lugdunensis TaxID=28035 RepID=A0A4Q9W6K8_STALU|nr:hypothetical protein FO457_05820 [Staphylococcus lugdunensis]QEX35387.1 hypothetical protein FO455_02585 [Staphylococcus lugdunensis]TBW70662.1 hypothetical protein EQ812_11420 [Staphylococcus lugdunensis]
MKLSYQIIFDCNKKYFIKTTMFVQSLIDPCGIKTDILLIYIGMRNRTLYNYTINKNDKNYLSSYIYRSIA